MTDKKEKYYAESIGINSNNKLFPILPNITVHITQSHSFFSPSFTLLQLTRREYGTL